MRIVLILLIMAFSTGTHAQSISGTVQDDKKELIINATVQVFQAGILKGGAVTDYDGRYVVKPLEPGYYDVLVTYSGYDSALVSKVFVSANENTHLAVAIRSLRKTSVNVVTRYRKPLVNTDDLAQRLNPPGDGSSIPVQQVSDLPSTSSGPCLQKTRSNTVSMAGARQQSTMAVVYPAPPAQFTVPGNKVYTRNEIKRIPTTRAIIPLNLNDWVSMMPGVYQQRRGDDVHIYGSR